MAVATDYVCIPFWEETNPDYFVIPSEDLKEDFKNKGIPEKKLLPLGIPTAKTYRQPYDKKEYKNTKNIVILPFTDKISDYMKASDIILSKPGGLTTTEIATLRKPFIHTMPIPGCENYNANFFDKRKMAIKCDTIEEVVENTKKLLKDETLQNEMIEKQEKYIRKDTCDKITDIVISEMQKK